MKCRILIFVFCLAALIGSAAGQTKTAALRPPSTPDIQGIWNFATITPLERPAELAGKRTVFDAAGRRSPDHSDRLQ